MAIAITLAEYLENEGVSFDLVAHPHSNSSLASAESAHIPGDQLAKSVVLEDEEGILLAVIPATHKLDLNSLERCIGRKLGLVPEQRLRQLFYDCEFGAIPPIGRAYGYETILDDSLMEHDDVYFEAGDHVDLVHLTGDAFHSLMEETDHAQFSYHL
jgi:Ala-tRNA(Pro) deacylase